MSDSDRGHAVAPDGRGMRGYTPVMQFEWSIFEPELKIPGVERIHYRTFAKPAAELEEPKGTVAVDAEGGARGRTGVADAVFDAQRGTCLRQYGGAGDVSLAAPAMRLLGLLREEDWGWGRSSTAEARRACGGGRW